MEKFRDRLQKYFEERPSTVFHYTTPSGLLGIFESGKIRATSVFHLNDAQEFRQALQLAPKILKEMSSSQRETEEQRFLHVLSESLGWVEKYPVGVACFSEQGDLLSQWRAYSAGHGALSIGFDVDYLVSQSEKQAYEFWKCIYNETEQRRLLRLLFETACAQFKNKLSKGHEKSQWDFAYNFASVDALVQLTGASACFKHPAFSEEREWRLVSTGLNSGPTPVRFRATDTKLIPYTEFDLGAENTSLGIQKIVVGPTPHVEDTKHALSLMLESRNFEKIEVEVSSCPYRSW